METEDTIPCFIATAFPLERGVPGWGCGWYKLVILETLKQEDQKFKASLSYMKSLEASLGYTRLSFKKKKKQPKQTITV